MKQVPLYDVIFQSSSKQFQSNIWRPNDNRNFYAYKKHLDFEEVKSTSWVDFSKFLTINFFCDVIISKLGKKGLKVVYHVSRVIERSKSKFDGTLNWGVASEMIFLLLRCSFDSCGEVIKRKLGQKMPKLVFHVTMVIERWKLIVKGNLR